MPHTLPQLWEKQRSRANTNKSMSTLHRAKYHDPHTSKKKKKPEWSKGEGSSTWNNCHDNTTMLLTASAQHKKCRSVAWAWQTQRCSGPLLICERKNVCCDNSLAEIARHTATYEYHVLPGWKEGRVSLDLFCNEKKRLLLWSTLKVSNQKRMTASSKDNSHFFFLSFLVCPHLVLAARPCVLFVILPWLLKQLLKENSQLAYGAWFYQTVSPLLVFFLATYYGYGLFKAPPSMFSKMSR